MTKVVAGGPGPSRPDILKILVTRVGDVPADRADLLVTIKGSTLVTGRPALAQVKEVARLVAELIRLGLDEGAIQLRGVHAEPAGGRLGRASSASYSLRVRCTDLDSLADLLGVVSDREGATLEAIAWGYGDEEGLRAGWLEDCIRRANGRARAVAAGLGVTLLGVHTFSEVVIDQESSQAPPPLAPDEPAGVRGFAAVRSRGTRDALGLAVAHTKRVELRVAVEYRISGFDAGAGAEGSGEAHARADGG